MKIILLITGLGGGGAEKVVVDLADQMVLKGHQVKVAFLTGSIIVKPISSKVELVYLGLESIKLFYSAYMNYKKLLTEFQPDIVHSHMVHANIFARLSRIFYSIPKLVCSAHSSNEGGYMRMLAYRLTNSLADITTNVSEEASQNFINCGAVSAGCIKTVYNGVDLTRFEKKIINNLIRHDLNISRDTPLFIAVGRFHDAKDYPNLLHAFAKIKSSFIFKLKKPKLIIVGDGDLREELEKKILELELTEDIHLLGRRDDVSELLNIADFFVLSSKYEGLPTVVIEAMACEKYVIATDCGGSAEILGDTGKLVPIQDSEALAKTIESVLNLDNQVIAENNQRARKRVEDIFSLDKSVSKWLEIYESK